jgi:hypothetical protein
MAKDPDYLVLRGRLSEAQEELRAAESGFLNAIEALRRKIILFETPEDVDMDAVKAAIADMRSQRAAYARTREEINKLRARLGMDAAGGS